MNVIHEDIDALCAELTAFRSMDEFMATDPSYSPTVLVDSDVRYAILAREFNRRAEQLGQDRRARVEIGKLAVYGSRSAAARAWAKQHHYDGSDGGWVFTPDTQPVAQGWQAFGKMLQEANRIVGLDGIWIIVD